jgi:signal peptidase I
LIRGNAYPPEQRVPRDTATEQTAAAAKGGGIKEFIKTILWAVVIALTIRTFAFEPFNIPSASMVPTLLVGDYLFVSKYAYGYSRYSLPYGLGWFNGRIMDRPPERGDVAVFRLPSDPRTDYIKRVMGLPGDRLQIIRGVLHINGEPVRRDRVEDWIEAEDGRVTRLVQYVETLSNGRQHRILHFQEPSVSDNSPIYEVPAGHYFMMGDNRDNSQDSRYRQVGFVPGENLVGRAEILFFSTDGSAALWELWRWPGSVRYGRLLQRIR